GEWINKKSKALHYYSDHFTLVSNADAEIVKRAAVRLDDIYAAYARFLPPRKKQGKPTKILLISSMEEYQNLLKQQNRNILNPAFFDTRTNEVVCGTDLKAIGESLTKVRLKHTLLLQKLADEEADLKKKYPNPRLRPAPVVEQFRQIMLKRQEIEDA